MRNYIGYLPYENIQNIPTKHVPSHEYIFFLHDNCAKLLVEYESGNVDKITLDKIIEIYNKKFKNNNSDIIEILQFCKDKGLDAPYFHYLTSKLLMGLTSDLLQFIYEALKCFEERKFSVAYSLLRKPFKENLIFICWLFNNYEHFIELFEQETDKTLNNIHGSERKVIFSETIKNLPLPELFNAELLDDMIFSKQYPLGLEIPCQKATHLITSQGSFLKTGKMFINSIFDDPNDISQYDSVYTSLPYIMLFTTHVIIEGFNKLINLNSTTYQHLILTSIASYENLYTDGKKRLLTKSYAKQMKNFLKCIHCKKQIILTKENALRMFMIDNLICNNCHMNSSFPFYWILSQTQASITQKNTQEDNIWKDTILSRMFKSKKL